MPVFGIFVKYDWNGPTYAVGIFLTREQAEEKMDSQFDWDVENGFGDAFMYFITKIPLGTISCEREDTSHVELGGEE